MLKALQRVSNLVVTTYLVDNGREGDDGREGITINALHSFIYYLVVLKTNRLKYT